MKGLQLVEAMRAEMHRRNDLGTAYRLAGEIERSDDSRLAASKLLPAISALEIAIAGEAEAKERALS